MEMTTTTDLADRWHAMQFGVRRSIRYHQRRRGFFDGLDQFSNMLSVIFGSAAIYGVLAEGFKGLALAASGLVTVLAAINLVIGSARRAREHSDFARRYVVLEKRLLAEPSEAEYLLVANERLDIEAEEPPVLHVLNSICHNEMMRAMGYQKSEQAKIGWFQRLVSPVFDLCEHSIH